MMSSESTGITIAAKKGDLQEIKKILKKRPEAIAETDSSGWNALHAAASNAQQAAVRYLLKRGIPLNVTTSTGMSPMFLATFKGHGDVVELLISMEASMGVQDDKGDTALHCAYSWGHNGIAALLLGNLADDSIMNNKKKKPSEVARYKKPVLVPAKKGMRVEGNCRGLGSWYPGTITFVHMNHVYDIDYDDGDTEQEVPIGCVRAIGGGSLLPPPPPLVRRLAVGDGVEVNYNESGEWYPGVVTRVGPNRMYDVQYDDGEQGMNIRKRLIRFVKERTPNADGLLALTAGDRVEVRYRGQAVWFPGVIRNVGPNGVYDVTYDNGEWEPVDRASIRLVDEERRKELERKAHILADICAREEEKRDRAKRKAAERRQKEAEALKAAAQKRAVEVARERENIRMADLSRLRQQRRAEAARLAQKRAEEDSKIASKRNTEDDAIDTAYVEDVKRAEATEQVHSVIDDARVKAKKDRISVLNLLDVTMKEELEFVKNDRRITAQGYEVVCKVADILLKYPELQMHIEGHTKCIPGNCDSGCINRRLSQARVENVREALDQAGCQNVFMTKGWGCKHPEVGAERTVRIFPEDLDYEDEDLAKVEIKQRAEETARAAEAEVRRLTSALEAKRNKLAQRRAKEDSLRAAQRDAEDMAIRAEMEAQDIRSSLEKARQDRIDALNLIEDTMREEIDFVVNDSGITPEGQAVCRKIATILVQYPELQIHIESHTSCKPGHCDPQCKLFELSQNRVNNVRDALIAAGCENKFMTKGWGCKHPKVGAERVVKIYPEDLEYSMEDDTLRVAEKKAFMAAKALKAATGRADEDQKLRDLEREEDEAIAAARMKEDAEMQNQRRLEDAARAKKFAEDVKAVKLSGKINIVIDSTRVKAKKDRIDALNLIEDTMKEEIEFIKNEAGLTFDGYAVCTRVANVLLRYPELQIHVESHTSCKAGRCNPECKLLGLSQARVDNVRDALIDSGCENIFFTKGWGCKHPEVGAERCVKIFPEDLNYEDEEKAQQEDERKAKEAARAADEEVRRLTQQMKDRELRLARVRAEDDARRAELRRAEDEDRTAVRVRNYMAAKERARRDRLAALDHIEDTMKEEVGFVRNEKNMTPEGIAVVQKVAKILNDFPELQIHIEGHSFCRRGHCNPDCKLMKLSQGRVDTVRDCLVSSGCTNEFITKGWGCRHPEIGAVRAVKIFPEDLEYDY